MTVMGGESNGVQWVTGGMNGSCNGHLLKDSHTLTLFVVLRCAVVVLFMWLRGGGKGKEGVKGEGKEGKEKECRGGKHRDGEDEGVRRGKVK